MERRGAICVLDYSTQCGKLPYRLSTMPGKHAPSREQIRPINSIIFRRQHPWESANHTGRVLILWSIQPGPPNRIAGGGSGRDRGGAQPRPLKNAQITRNLFYANVLKKYPWDKIWSHSSQDQICGLSRYCAKFWIRTWMDFLQWTKAIVLALQSTCCSPTGVKGLNRSQALGAPRRFHA